MFRLYFQTLSRQPKMISMTRFVKTSSNLTTKNKLIAMWIVGKIKLQEHCESVIKNVIPSMCMAWIVRLVSITKWDELWRFPMRFQYPSSLKFIELLKLFISENTNCFLFRKLNNNLLSFLDWCRYPNTDL